VRAWQAGRGLPDTGFLTEAQVGLLAQDVALREAEIAEEARRAQEAAEAADRAFWRDTGAGADEAGLRAYLARHPQGLFSEVARGRLAEIEAGRDRAAWDAARRTDTAEAYRGYLRDWPSGQFVAPARTRLEDLEGGADRAAWERARVADTRRAYRRYLDDHPQGRFVDEARARLAALRPDPEPDPEPDPAERAQAEEAALNLNFVARSMVEAQLGFLGFEPGAPDGRFDGRTRAAVAAFQRARGHAATGFVDRETLRLLIAEGLPLATFD
jgi:peptidoglycan hydrolase-like protein with peptidoglycan-binding domain